MRIFLKKIIFLILNFGKLSLSKKASILMYHSVGENRAFFTVSREDFLKQMNYLHKHNFRVIRLSELIKRIKNKEDISNCVCLTFDDGYLDNLEIALPILKKYNFPATIFVITDLLGGSFKNSEGIELKIISENDIKNADLELLDFMPHTQSHILLDGLRKDDYSKELLLSKSKLEELIRLDASILAYPKGKYSESVINYLKLNNWSGAVTVEPGLIDKDSDLYKLNRNAVVSNTSFLEFKVKVSNRLENYIRLKNV